MTKIIWLESAVECRDASAADDLSVGENAGFSSDDELLPVSEILVMEIALLVSLRLQLR